MEFNYVIQNPVNQKYGRIQDVELLMDSIQRISDRELYDAVEQIYLAELRSVEEIRLLLD